jgi:hypothetical protein
MNRGDEAISEKKILNLKHQILNKRKEDLIRLIQIPMLKTFRILIFGFVWRLNFGIWNLVNEIATPRQVEARNDTEGYYLKLQTYEVSPSYSN